MEGLVVERTEVVLVIVVDVEWAQTLLFLRDSDLVEMLFIKKASRSESGKDVGNNSGNGSFRAMDMDAMLQ
jgi:hypothetical protein